MLSKPDPFETLRDCRSLYLRQLGRLLEQSGALSGAAVQAVQQGCGNWFDEIVASRQRGSFKEEADGLTSSRITLVGNDDLELDIRLDNLTARLLDSAGSNLWKTHLRFVTLLRRPDLPKSSNPVGPAGIRQGLSEMFAAAGTATLDKKLDLVDKLETSLLAHLPPLYAQLNDFLEQAGVETAQPTIVTAPETARKTAEPETPESGNLLLALQQSLLALTPVPSGGAPLQPADGGSSATSPAAALLNQAAKERLLQRLDELDRRNAPNFDPARSNSLESLIPGLFTGNDAPAATLRQPLDADSLGLPAYSPEAVVIDTLALIFAKLLADPKLPEPLKAIISSLQITLLKIAMQDAAFFTDPAHPARRLLDRMAEAMLGLPPDVARHHPVCLQLSGIADALRSGFSGKPDRIVQACREVEAVIAAYKAGIMRHGESFLPLLAQLDRREQALGATHECLDPLIAADLPPTVRAFLDQSWRRLLVTIWLESGPQSSQWETHLKAVTELLWTFQPKVDAQGRALLARRLPEILQLLKSGMERIGLAADAQAAFLDACFALQTRAMRTTPSPAGNPASGPGIDAPDLRGISDATTDTEISSGSLTLRSLGFAGLRPPPARGLPVRPGDWLEIRLDGEWITALLCQFSPQSQRALLLDPERELALAIHPARLDILLRDGSARPCSAGALFEAAAAEALKPRSGE